MGLHAATTEAAAHLDFATGLLNLVDSTDPRHANWSARIAAGRRRLADDTCRLAVIGEFSSGKSTFINALLGADVFASSVRPTTGAAVWIRHGHRFAVTATFRDGRRWSGVAPTAGRTRSARRPERLPDLIGGRPVSGRDIGRHLDKVDLVTALALLTTDPVVTDQVTGVSVEYPAPALAEGLVIADTPGTNSGEEAGDRHVDVTRLVVTEQADAAVVVISALQPLPTSLSEFLTQTLDPGVLQRCVFLVTWSDQLEPEEYEQVRAEAARRIRAELGIEHPQLVLTSPMQALRAMRGDTLDPEREEWPERFNHALAWLRRVAEVRRPSAVADTAMRVVQELLADADALLGAELEELARKRRELATLVPADIGSFLGEQRDKGLAVLAEGEVAAAIAMRNLVESQFDRARSAVTSHLESCTSHDAVAKAVQDTVPSLVRGRLTALSGAAEAAVRNELDSRLGEVATALDAAFQREYAQLERIEGAPLPASTAVVAVDHGGVIGASNFAAASTVATDGNKQENLAMGWGAGTGAAIGTLIFPGVGTVVGGVIGLFAGAFFAPDIAKVRGEAIDKAVASTREIFSSARSRLEVAVTDAARGCREQFTQQVTWYQHRYGDAVADLHRAHRSAERALNTRRDRLKAASAETATRRAAVAAQRQALVSVELVTQIDAFGRMVPQ